uniref:Uncharacterized protein n=1 Tax=Anguilla anguilla TaxID=7936 RepID=A0A0E9SRJ8_ANGAN
MLPPSEEKSFADGLLHGVTILILLWFSAY